MLKNFSSLKAIVSGLQSNPVFRLRKAWQAVSKDKLEVFEELARIFSEDNNAVAQRELLVREGTARFADTVGENDHHLQKMLQKHQENSRAISYGTIPYLGTFLTDLTMIDTAIPDIVSEGLINFDKRRKEFEVLAQVRKTFFENIQPFLSDLATSVYLTSLNFKVILKTYDVRTV